MQEQNAALKSESEDFKQQAELHFNEIQSSEVEETGTYFAEQHQAFQEAALQHERLVKEAALVEVDAAEVTVAKQLAKQHAAQLGLKASCMQIPNSTCGTCRVD